MLFLETLKKRSLTLCEWLAILAERNKVILSEVVAGTLERYYGVCTRPSVAIISTRLAAVPNLVAPFISCLFIFFVFSSVRPELSSFLVTLMLP